MKTFGLIGYRLNHSFSKAYFTAKFKEQNISECEYKNFELDTIAEFKSLLNKELNIEGLNCTIPYKKSIIPYLHELDEEAKQIAAVNTIKVIRQDGTIKLKGFNTDCYGFEISLKSLLALHHRRALVLGTGGAAQAVHYILKKLGIEAIGVSRNPNEQQLNYTQLDKNIISTHTLIINATPVGTFPNVDSCPDIPYEYLTDAHYLYDLVYNPSLTCFLRKGQEKGAIIKNGAEMLHLQAERAWEIWNDNNIK